MAVNPKIAISGTSKIFTNALPEWYLGWAIDGYYEFAVSASLIRLSKFGIIDLMYDRSINGADYQGLWHTPFTEKMLEAQKFLRPQDSLEIDATNSVVFVNDYGKQFRQACR